MNDAHPLPLPRPPSRLATPPTDQPLQQNSITTFKELVPVRVATGRMLEGNWSGRELDDTRVIGSLFGGPHFILQLGYNQTVGYAASFRVVFVAHMPVPAGASMSDPGLHAEAEQTATGLMMMLNLRRVAPAKTVEATDPRDIQGRQDFRVAQAIEDAIPGKPLV
jgi:hypothetical protein